MADITITAANVTIDSQPVYEDVVAGAAITAGQACYIDSSGLAQLSDANGAAALRTVRGIAMNSAGTGQPVRLAKGTSIINIGATVVAGTIYVSSATAGGIAPAADITTGWYTTIIGVATTTGKIALSIFPSGAVT